MQYEAARGTRDMSGSDSVLRQQIIRVLTNLFEIYGFNPLDTPTLERLETLSSKYAGGAEILKEIFKLKDQGKRDLALRYDLTVPLARFIASNINLKMPFKRYAIGQVFRDGPLKIGRYREFTQCDVDVVGIESITADAEIVQIALAVFEKLELDVTVKINNRKLLDAILEASYVKKDLQEPAILSIDKLEKFGKNAVKKELSEKGLSSVSIRKLVELLSIEGTNRQKLDFLKNSLQNKTCINEVEELLNFANNTNVEFDVSLARGLAYYTGTVFEAVLKKSSIKSSVAGGGRYDDMIGNFVQNNRGYPAVGISFGLDVIADALKLENKNILAQSVTTLYIISIDQEKKAAALAEKLRIVGIKTDVNYSGKVGKAIEFANFYKIPFVAFLGKKEAAANKIKLRNMQTGKEKLMFDVEINAWLTKQKKHNRNLK